MAERSNAAVSKTVTRHSAGREFESPPLRLAKSDPALDARSDVSDAIPERGGTITTDYRWYGRYRSRVTERCPSWPKERDWKSRTCRKAGRGFESRPLRLFPPGIHDFRRRLLQASRRCGVHGNSGAPGTQNNHLPARACEITSATGGRIAQRESARFTRERSLVQSQLRPSRFLGRRLLPTGRGRPSEPPDTAGDTILSEPVLSTLFSPGSYRQRRLEKAGGAP